MKLTHFYRTVPNTYELMCMRGRGCNWVLRLTHSTSTRQIMLMTTKLLKRAPRISPWDSHSKKAATYSPALHCSTIGATGLNFSVRNGKRWDPGAITT